MKITGGIDVGTGSVKCVIMRCGERREEILARVSGRIRKRDVMAVAREVFAGATEEAGVDRIDYVATTGETIDLPSATGHFYGMTTHARGALHLDPEARTVLDVGALHTKAVRMDERGKVLNYKMSSQCASGSGQFLENIARYLGVSQAEIGKISLQGDQPEKVSAICAVLSETDVINMVSRGITTPNILRGIHESMAGRFAMLLRSLKTEGVVLVTGGLANDVGLLDALRAALRKDEERSGMKAPEVRGHSLSLYAGSIGAAIWGAFRHDKMEQGGVAWTAKAQA